MSSRFPWWLVASCVVGLSCAHASDGRPTRPWHPAFLDQLPRCASTEGAISVGEVAGRTIGERLVVRGRLAHEQWECTMMECVDKDGKSPACCNGCWTNVALVDPAGGGGQVRLQLQGERKALGISAQDCQAHLLDDAALARGVVASGVIAEPADLPVGEALLSDVRLCRAAD